MDRGGGRAANGGWLGPLLLTSALLWAFGIISVIQACGSKTQSPTVTVTCEHGESSMGPGRTTPAITGCAP